MSAGSLIRSAKNKILNYSSVELKVRKVTSNQNSIPSSTMLAELAMLSNNVYALDEMLKILNKRVNDDGKNWRHILKSLIVFQTLCLYGSDRALGYCKRTIHIFQQLRAFQYFDKDRRDVGIRIRELSKNLAEMLSDDNILKKAKAQPNEIKLFLKDELNKKYTAITQEEQIKNQIRKIDSNDIYSSKSSLGSTSNNCDSDEIRLARPQNPDEEMAQIKLAMELSLKEAQYKQTLSNPTLYQDPSNLLGKQESLIIFDVDQPCQENKPVYPSISHSISDPFISDSHSISDSKPQKVGAYSSELFAANIMPLTQASNRLFNLKSINNPASTTPCLEMVSETVFSPGKDFDQSILSLEKNFDQTHLFLEKDYDQNVSFLEKGFGQPVVSLKKGVDQTVLSPKKGADQTVLSPKKDVDQIVSNFLGTSGANLVDMSDFESKSRALGLHSSSRHLNPFNEPRNISAAVTNTVPKGFQSDSNVFSSSSVHQLKKSPEMSLRSQIGTLAPNNPFFKNQPAVSSRDQKFDDLFGELQSTQFSFDNNPAQPEKDLFSDF